MAAQTFDEWTKENKIIRYLPYFKRCWNAAIKSAEEKFNSSAQSGPTNTTQDSILLLRVLDHLDEIKFGCLHGLRADLKLRRAKLESVR